MKYVVAVSGGVDSVVLLDMLVKENAHELIVAHFDHGIRAESDWDARFVTALARSHGLLFETRREELGKDASEALARQQRYAFLNELKQQYGAKIVTAHHEDDVVETIAINLHRGTGWRGLAVLGNKYVERPLLKYRKNELYDYALKNNLEWVEDETNASDVYLRNRLRRKLCNLSGSSRSQIKELRDRQLELRKVIDDDLNQLCESAHSRKYIKLLPHSVAMEVLRNATAARLTRPQLGRLLERINQAVPGTRHTAGDGLMMQFSRDDIIVENTGKML